MRRLTRLLLLVLVALAANPVMAQSAWPARQVRLIVPLAAGGTADGVARVVAEKLSVIWGQQVLVENRAGGNTIIGTEALAKAAPDGYTIGMGVITSHVANAFLFAKLPYDADRDFSSLALLGISPIFLIVHPSVPAANLQEFLGYVRANPDKVSYASTGYGSSFHLATEHLIQRTGIRMVHVPYKGMGAALQDLLAGNVQVAMDVSTMSQVRQGKLKVLGVASTQRFAGAPDVPSFAEQGLPDFEFNTWLSLHAPAGLPADLQARISADVNRVLQMPDVRQRMLAMSYVPAGGTPAELSAHLASERRKIGGLIRAAGIKPE
ncbi:MAG: tripartite tricarboxylate transporter substrate binding protein [Proteobacteria bacterium]|nr:tripartite tricarboxylate transporter substrate binding protein [Pseudomonadota bacterium]